MMNERKNTRMDSINLLDYTVQDDDGHTVHQAMGRTLNVSETGILLDSHIPFKPGQILDLAIEFEEDIIDLKGTVVHTEMNRKGRFSSGIEFEGMDRESRKVLKNYLKTFDTASLVH